ncbi:MAG: hypothetical protein HYZ44_15815 [Bacteroidetes bacterium]|nr:hypothetical protein [Bacteroidota bacterium]
MGRVFLFAAIVFAIMGCASGQKPKAIQTAEDNPYRQLGNQIDSLPNSSNQFVLFVQKHDLTARNPILKAVVVETSSKKIVSVFSYTPGYCKWISETEIEVYNAPGMIKKDEDVSKYITTIKLKAKTPTP